MFEVFFSWEDDMIFLDEFSKLEDVMTFIENDCINISKIYEIMPKSFGIVL
jgi:hypothetical protein